jgi:hypothetical protein
MKEVSAATRFTGRPGRVLYAQPVPSPLVGEG